MVDSVVPATAISAPDSVAALIAALGGPAVVGRELGIKASTVGERKRTGVWPVDEFDLLVNLAKQRGVPGVTYEALAKMHIPAERLASSSEVRT